MLVDTGVVIMSGGRFHVEHPLNASSTDGSAMKAETGTETEAEATSPRTTFDAAGSSSFESLWQKLDNDHHVHNFSPRRVNSFGAVPEMIKSSPIRANYTFDQVDDRRSSNPAVIHLPANNGALAFSPERKRSIIPDLPRVVEGLECEEKEESAKVNSKLPDSAVVAETATEPVAAAGAVVVVESTVVAEADAVPADAAVADVAVADVAVADAVPAVAAVADAAVADAAVADAAVVVSAVIESVAAAGPAVLTEDAAAVLTGDAAVAESALTESAVADTTIADAVGIDDTAIASAESETETAEQQAVPSPPKVPRPSSIKHDGKPAGGRRLSLY